MWGCRLIAVCLTVLAAASEAAAAGSRPAPVVHVTVFRSAGCAACALVEPAALMRMGTAAGCTVRARTFDIDDVRNYALLVRLERRLGDTDNDPPVVIVGDRVLGGEEEIEAHLAAVIRAAAARGGAPPVELPADEPPPETARTRGAAPTVHLTYFEQPGCRRCRRVEHLIAFYEEHDPTVIVRRFAGTDRRTRLLHAVLAERAGVPGSEQFTVPAVFVGRRALVGEAITDAALAELIDAHRVTGGPDVWAVDDAALADAERRLHERFRTLGVPAAIVNGLFDGVNPCALATIAFFITYLVGLGRSRRLLVAVGLAYCAGVFAAYFAVGLGASEVLLRLRGVPVAAAVLHWIIVGLVFLLAAASLRDALVAVRGGSGGMILKVPDRLRTRINALLARRLRARHLVPASFVSGAVVSLLELVCTGQMYLPTVELMLSVSADRARTVGLLLIYNTAFVIPLLALLAASALGFRSEALGPLLKRHLAAAKLLLAALFTALGVILIVVG